MNGSEKPNILIIHAHDMGRYISPYGYAASTPSMAALCRGGILFRQAHSAAPTCSPSRAALLTGQTAHQAGVLGLTHRGGGSVSPNSHHLAAYLAEHSYESCLAGHQHELTRSQVDAIYSSVFPSSAHPFSEQDRGAAADAARFIGSPHAKPWFLWLGFFYPHREFLPADSGVADPAYVRPPEIFPDTAATRLDMAEYYASVAATDACIDQVMKALEESGAAGHTLVVLTTDHGIAFPQMKCNLTGHGTGVTLAMRLPGVIPERSVTDSLVSHLDLFPTLCEIAGVPVPPWALGKPLQPVFENPASEIRDDLFAEVNFHAAAEPMRSVRTQRHNYIRLYDEDLRRPLANIDAGHTKTQLLETGWGASDRDHVQLYDLELDPLEQRNVAEDPRYGEIRTEMESRLLRWMEKTDDPLLRGPLVPPPGIVLQTREALQP